MANETGLVIEMAVDPDLPHGPSMRQIVIFKGMALVRNTTPENPRKHWRGARYPADERDALDAMNDSSWLGRYLWRMRMLGYELMGRPFLMEANEAEVKEISEGRMPRAMVLRINKCREEMGTPNPWKDEE